MRDPRPCGADDGVDGGADDGVDGGADDSADTTVTRRPILTPVPAVPEPPRFLSHEAFMALLTDVRQLAPGRTSVSLDSRWRSDVRWARNRILMAGDWRTTDVGLTRGGAGVVVNQLDSTSLRNAVAWAEVVRQQFEGGPPAPAGPLPWDDPETHLPTAIWSDSTYAQSADDRLAIAQQLIDRSNAAGMWSAGYLSVEATGYYREIQGGRVEYVPMTFAQCSIAVRAPDGKGSGWAGRSSYDWNRLGAERLAEIALEKCRASRNPVRIEPGRYALILEPQATFDFTKSLFGGLGLPYVLWLQWTLNNSEAPFRGTQHTTIPVSRYDPPVELASTKIGERIFDERISLRFDPLDPDLGGKPFIWDPGASSEPYIHPKQPAHWVTNGVLTELGYPVGFHRGEIAHYNGPVNIHGIPYTGSFRMDGSGPLATVEEMIATTERGLLVTRFWAPRFVDRKSMLITGTTRDGLWLIEHGKIKHPVRNMRWADSPLYVFNKVEQIGVSVPIFNPGTPAVVPPLKVHEFNFTMLEDAI